MFELSAVWSPIQSLHRLTLIESLNRDFVFCVTFTSSCFKSERLCKRWHLLNDFDPGGIKSYAGSRNDGGGRSWVFRVCLFGN